MSLRNFAALAWVPVAVWEAYSGVLHKLLRGTPASPLY